MDEERPLREARQAMTTEDSSTVIVAGAGTPQRNNLLIPGIVLVVALIIAGLFLPPISLGQYLGFGGDGVADVDVEPAETADDAGLTLVDPERQAGVSRLARADFETDEKWSDAVAALPADLSLQSDIYLVDFDGDDPPAGQLSLTLSPASDAAALDLYRWDGAAWRFVPIQSAGGEITADSGPLARAYALMSPTAESATVAGELLPGRELSAGLMDVFDELLVGTLTLSEGGELAGDIAEPEDGPQPEYLRATNTGVIVDQQSLAGLLNDAALQQGHIQELVSRAGDGRFDGVNLDYQGVDAAQRGAFTAFVGELADALEAGDMDLIVTLGAPRQAGDGRWDTGGQDWAAIGQIADLVYLQMPLNPAAYDDDGRAQKIIDYAVRRVDRRNLMMFVTANAVDMLGEQFIEVSADLALGTFGAVILVDDETAAELISDPVLPGTSLELTLDGDAGPLQWDPGTLAYRYTYGEPGQQHTVWLSSEAALAHRLRFADRYNLRGAAVRGLGGVFNQDAYVAAIQSFMGTGDPPQPAAAAIIWLVKDESGGVLASSAGEELTFNWQTPQEPGEYTINAGVAQGENVTDLGALTVAVATPEPTPEPTEEPVVEAEPTATTAAAPARAVPLNIGDADAIVNSAANVRTGPGLTYPRVGDGLQRGAKISLIGRNDGSSWYNIILPDGETEGWIFNTLVDLNPELNVAALPVVQVDPPPVAGGDDGAPSDNVGAPPAPIGNTGFELGGQTHSLANPTLMAYAGMDWVKFQHKWSPGQNGAELAGRINQAHANGFKVLLSIPGADTYPSSIDFAGYAQFLGQVAAQGPDAIEVWNEMNIDFEWPAGQIDPSSYVSNMLAPAYQAIKAANANVMVVGGAPAPTGYDNGTNAWSDSRYMSGVAAAGGANYMDCVGVHYNEGIVPPSQQTGDPRVPSEYYTRYFWGMVNTYWNAFGGARPLCFTELGYLSGDGFGGLPDRFSWASGTSVQEQASWLAQAASLSSSSGKVRMMIIFNVDFTYYDPSGDPQAGYGMVRPDGSCPACETLHQVTGGR